MKAVLVCLISVAAALASADEPSYGVGAYIPPLASKTSLESALHAMPQDQVDAYLGQIGASHVFDVYEGRNAELIATADDSDGYEVAAGYNIDLPAAGLFGTGFVDGAGEAYVAAVTSVDALAVRLLVDLSALEAGEEVWVLDPALPRAFGPYTAADRLDGGRWLSTVAGDTAVILGRTPGPGAPQLTVTTLSHFYREPLSAKNLSCNINIACETDATIQQISSAVCLILRPGFAGSTVSGTGSLINAPGTPEFEPYLLTANHVIGTESQALNAEAYWDYRSTACDANNAPSLSSLPRSSGTALLVKDETLDGTLLQLDTVPVGQYGRAYLGWDAREPVKGESVIGIHHPDGTHMRISYGRIQTVDKEYYPWKHETRVGWDDGVTEGGSSGSPLLYDDGTLRVLGALTAGPQHVCGAGPTRNFDVYSSFREFLKELILQGYLTGSNSGSGYSGPAEHSGCAGGDTQRVPLMGDLALLAALMVVLTLAPMRVHRPSR